MDHFAGIFVNFQRRGTEEDPKGTSVLLYTRTFLSLPFITQNEN